VLQECGALKQLLPEVTALFGVPQIADDPAEVDLGDHLLKSLEQAALCNAPLSIRYALLVMNVGKSDSPKEHLPVHYGHMERGRPRIDVISARFGVTQDCRDLALLALDECERVHRVSEVRAGPVAMMLDRLDAFGNPERFAHLMTLCACDFRAYGNRAGRSYPKADLLIMALEACHQIGPDPDDLQDARAQAIAKAFHSQRWSNPA
jgi:tRNA nucleotidyltransferase (CCA-adding enzyme)